MLQQGFYESEHHYGSLLSLQERSSDFIYAHIWGGREVHASTSPNAASLACKRNYEFAFIGLQAPAAEFVVDVESMDIFPVGWCEANAYNLSAPRKAACKYTKQHINIANMLHSLSTGD